jgi:hypothetical protein
MKSERRLPVVQVLSANMNQLWRVTDPQIERGIDLIGAGTMHFWDSGAVKLCFGSRDRKPDGDSLYGTLQNCETAILRVADLSSIHVVFEWSADHICLHPTGN